MNSPLGVPGVRFIPVHKFAQTAGSQPVTVDEPEEFPELEALRQESNADLLG